MWEALIAAVATAVMSRASEDIGNAAQSTWTTLFRKVRGRLGTRATLIDAGDRDALEQALRDIVDEDPAFAARMQALLRQLGEAPALTVPSPGLPVPATVRLLPAGPADFVNRTGPLAALDEIRGHGEAGATPVVVLRGTPGAGKTALALRWGHKRQDWFGGGQLYADLRELPDAALGGPESTENIVTSFLLAMGVPSSLVPDSFAARLALYRTMTADRPVLLLLRGAALPAQISPLIPTAAGSMVLVSTERDVRGLAMDGARFIDVGPLDDSAARELLEAVSGREGTDPAPVRRVIDLCGHLPIAIRIVGARLRLDPGLTLADLVRDLESEPDLLGDEVGPLFQNVYRHLSDSAQELYRTFGAVPVAEVTDGLLARLGWSDHRARRAATDELIGLNLLERPGPGRWAQHPLIRAHAAGLSAHDEVVAATVDYFCEFAEAADRAIMGDRRRLITGPPGPDGPPGRAEALDELERGREDLLRVARAGLALGANEQVARLATAAQALYFNHPHLADWTEMSELGIAAAQRLGRADVEVQIRCTLSGAHSAAGDLRRAQTEIDRALALLPAADDPVLAGTVWEFNARLLDRVARAASESDQPTARAKAEDAFRTAIATFHDVGLPRGVALGHLYYGAFLDSAGRPADALTELDQAREGLNAAGDDRNATRADAAIGAAHLHLGHFRVAYEELAAAAAYLAVSRLWRYELEVRENLVLAATALGDRAAVAEHAERAAEIRRLSSPGK
ncbi:hypothetical protein [Actinoplanes sp. HUAS TT8]|uniref:hypothetical protein n=1 Tax=Actinoplanes sp. HUAS TT8 TaxID=3447453 RepID=UPI003F522E39